MRWIRMMMAGMLFALGPALVWSQSSEPGSATAGADASVRASDPGEGLPSVSEADRNSGSANVAQHFWDRFSTLDPIYFALGWRGGFHAKFQVSFKYRVLKEKENASHARRFSDDFYFGYTQFSLWDLGEESAPFRDTNYKPGAFYENDFFRDRVDGIDSTGLRVGFEHESNGQGGPDSRSLNILYVRPRFVLGDREKYYFEVAPKAYAYVGDLSDNPDIDDYRGYVDLFLRTGYGDTWQVATTLRHGTKKHHGSVQVDASYPLRCLPFMDDLGGYLHMQYFNGWGESLLDYNHKLESQIRFGIMILR